MIVLGHRGGRGHGWPPENTLAAFARAIDEGADGVELDVRLTADGVPVVLHDPTLAYVTEGEDRRPVHRMARADLPRLEGDAEIPSLEEALDALRGKIVNVELKADVAGSARLGHVPDRLRLARAAAAVVARASGRGAAEIVFTSFDPLTVLALAAIAPKVPRGVLVDPRMPKATIALPLAMRPAIVAAHIHQRVATPARIERLRRAGLRVCAWTVDDPARARALAAQGVAWIITDWPAEIVSLRRT
ncbi:MAG: glycerophosphodiester phosphodiesterase [Labilithrix sp.]|nr:glycerophosphodiester phosphodiesterase [Labilithrix sp.]